jgi:MFS family permease
LLAHRPFRALLAAGGLLGLLTTSDALIYLVMQQRGDVPTTGFPLLFVATGTVYLLLAAPAGRLSDRWGRHRVFLCGHVLVLAIYALLSRHTLGPGGLVACVALLGAFYAATDGVLAALASGILPGTHLTTGLAVVGTTTALARLLASPLFGTLWSWYGPATALLMFAAGLAPSVLLSALLLRVDCPWAVGRAR